MKLDLKIPSFSTLSRGAQELEIPSQNIPSNETLVIIVDSKGLKIYGEGEWLLEKHQPKRHRPWPKLHLAIDPRGNVVVSKLTNHLADDAQTIPELLGPLEAGIKTFCVDGA